MMGLNLEADEDEEEDFYVREVNWSSCETDGSRVEARRGKAQAQNCRTALALAGQTCTCTCPCLQ